MSGASMRTVRRSRLRANARVFAHDADPRRKDEGRRDERLTPGSLAIRVPAFASRAMPQLGAVSVRMQLRA